VHPSDDEIEREVARAEARARQIDFESMSRNSFYKDAVKEGFKEWLDEQVLKVGWWTVRVFAVALVGALVYLILKSQGYMKLK
jgi:hypothetical protein